MSDDNFGPWIDWAGGECPIPDAKAGEFEIRNHEGDEEGSDQPAIWWSSGANDWWKNGRIIAYRVRLPADDLLRQAIEDERDRALWLATSFDVHRYLMACTSGRLSGAEKAERHQNLSEAFCYVLTGVEGARGYKIQRAIHDATQELTNHLDRIGLERDDPSPDYDAIAKKFFDGFKAIAARAVLTAYDKRGQS